jgi:branched-chain amino acid transport system permease protein
MTTVAQVLVDGLSIGATYALLALGISLIFSVMGFVNFAYGALIVWSGYTLHVSTGLGVPYPLAVLIMLGAAMLISLAIAELAFLPFLSAPPATLLLTSFGVTLISQAVAIFAFGEAPRAVPTPHALGTSLDVEGVRVSVLQIVAFGLGISVLLLLNLLLHRTDLGVHMRAAAEDGDTAALMGVQARATVRNAFMLSGAIAAVVAFIWFARIGTVEPRADLTPTLKAFIAVVFGGIGTVRGAVVGGIVLGMLEAVLAATLSPSFLAFQQSFAFAILILLLIVRPSGLVGRPVEVSK